MKFFDVIKSIFFNDKKIDEKIEENSSKETSEIKLCRDCQFCQLYFSDETPMFYPICHHEKANFIYDSLMMITGEQKIIKDIPCEYFRKYGCGIEAKYFKKNDTI